MTRAIIPGVTNIDDWLYESLNKPICPDYQVRFINPEDVPELVNLYHLARTALSHKAYHEQNPHCRMLWACEMFARHRFVSETAVYKDLSGLLGR